MTDVIHQLASFIDQTTYDSLPNSIIDITKHLLLDSLGCALASITTDRGKMNIALARKMGGPPDASIIGIGDKVSNVTASFVNAELINTTDYDALILPGGHLPPYVIPPALAVAENKPTSGKQLLLALALAFEIAARVPKGIIQNRFEGDGDNKKFSWGTRWGQAWSSFGATTGAIKLLGMTADQMAHALGIAGHLNQSLTHVRYSFGTSRPLTKYGVPGWQNTGGMMAAILAESGYTGDTTLFEGEYGFFQMCGYEGRIDLPSITHQLGEEWSFGTVIFKPFPCCWMLHGGVECIQNIMDKNQILPNTIDRIEVLGHPTIELPAFQHKEVNHVTDAQFNAAYLFSLAAMKVPVGLHWQDTGTMTDPVIREMMEKVVFSGHPQFIDKTIKHKFSQYWTVNLHANGKIYREELLYPKGAPVAESAMTENELVDKFQINAERILTREKITNALDMILNLEELEDVSTLTEALSMR